jgi:hypothetical protein
MLPEVQIDRLEISCEEDPRRDTRPRILRLRLPAKRVLRGLEERPESAGSSLIEVEARVEGEGDARQVIVLGAGVEVGRYQAVGGEGEPVDRVVTRVSDLARAREAKLPRGTKVEIETAFRGDTSVGIAVPLLSRLMSEQYAVYVEGAAPWPPRSRMESVSVPAER